LASGYGYGLGHVFLLSAVYFWLGCLLSFVGFFLSLAGVKNANQWLELAFLVGAGVWLTWGLPRRAHLMVHNAERWVDDVEREGRTFPRVLARALRKYAGRVGQPAHLPDRMKEPEPGPSVDRPLGK
jgi:hypothetical protein